MDSVFPPACASCNSPGSILCSACIEKVNLIGSSVCLSCGNPQKTRINICESCLENPPVFSGMLSWANYENTVRDSVHSLKYKNNIALGYFFALKLLPELITAQWPIDLVIPVPLSKSHLKSRGYNQATLISRPLSRALHILHETRGLLRVRETSTQTKLSAEQRFLNVEGAFSGNPAKLSDKNVLLVDDVITTGATMINCTKALLTSGASKVFCISVARVIV